MRTRAITLMLVVLLAIAVTGCGSAGNNECGTADTVEVESDSVGQEALPEGKEDPDISVEVYDPERAFNGTTLFADIHDADNPRIVEVNMLGEVVWEYEVPDDLKEYGNPGFDVEWVPETDTVLFMLPRYGVCEVDRDGNLVWSYRDTRVTHDADRLDNGNTLVVNGNDDFGDEQVKEINPEGEVVWSWYARDHFRGAEYRELFDHGWTHTNAAVRMDNGHTLISPRNFDMLVEVDEQGSVVRTIGEGILVAAHDPEVLDNGNVLVANHIDPPNWAVEIDPETGEVVWEFGGSEWENQLVRDADRLPNGNTMLTGTSAIAEVTPEGEVVWQLRLEGEGLAGPGAHTVGMYKAERIGI